MKEMAEHLQRSLTGSFAELFKDRDLLARVFDCFPYPLEIYAPDGTTVLVNKAMLDEYHTISADMVVGKYNIFKDPYIIALGQIDKLRRAFQGKLSTSMISGCPWKILLSCMVSGISIWKLYTRILRFFQSWMNRNR